MMLDFKFMAESVILRIEIALELWKCGYEPASEVSMLKDYKAQFSSLNILPVLVVMTFAPSTAVAQDAPEMRTIFADEFDSGELDREKWNVEGPDFWVNNEQQAYIDSTDTIRFLSADEVEGSEDGVLELRALYRPDFELTEPQEGRVADFVSGRINTRDNFDFTYGRAAARIRMPDAEGIWPAFWMLGNGSWPETGEVDIMEYVGEADWTGVALHGPGYSGETPIVNKYFFPTDTDVTDWHVYAVEWDADAIVFTVDDRVTYRATRPMVEFYGEWRFDTPKFLILNLAIGGIYPFKTSGIDDPYYGLPAETVERIQDGGLAIQIDWVRVTQSVQDD